jgi:hypothetical protein
MNKTHVLIILMLSFLATDFTHAYPPDNAAVLYYKQMELFAKPDEATWNELTELPFSNKPASEEAKAFIEKQKKNYLIPELEIASELEHCDWGIDVSQGFELRMPGLSQMRNFHYLLLADSAIQASQGDLAAALEKNLTVRRIGHHVSNDNLISFLVSMAISRSCDKALTHLLDTYPLDEKTLVDLKNELLWQSYRPTSIRHPLMMEKEVCLLEISIMTPERYKLVMGDSDETDDALEYLKDIDQASREKEAVIYTKYYDDIFTIIEKPYKQAYEEMCVRSDKLSEDSDLSVIFLPTLSRCYSLLIGWKTSYDSMMTALDVYIIAAKTGKLPEQLPKSTYLDHFSGKPFIYEVTDDGFTLKCQQEDLVKKTIHEFSYKLPK